MPQKRRRPDELDPIVERLREFLRFDYVTTTELARRLGVRDGTLYAWLSGTNRPTRPERIAGFLDSVPDERGSGTAPTGYQYHEYKNWRGIPKPRRCPFCKRAKGEIRKAIRMHR